jgi:hypothetical protein
LRQPVDTPKHDTATGSFAFASENIPSMQLIDFETATFKYRSRAAGFQLPALDA